ncbi:MAG: twin-arginine translocation signal domain-containing protein [Candidatus Rokubacteria bacterium]|nr:twin-arginine translocation signal domain-containing protein [Candidatus Rokubacteria bacterium]
MAKAMMRRRDFIGASAAMAAMATAPRVAWAQARQPKRGGTLRQVGFEPPTFDIHDRRARCGRRGRDR